MPDITAGYVEGLYRWGLRQPQERGLRTFIKEIRDLFDMHHRVQIPKEYRAIAKEVRSPLLRDIALRITASLTKDPPVYHVPGRDTNVDGDHASSIASRWLMAQIDGMNRLADEDVTYEAALALVRDSESVIKVVHRPDAWATFPTRKPDEDPKEYNKRVEKYVKGGVYDPYAWREVDRLQMLFGDGEYGDEWALEYGEYSAPYMAYPDTAIGEDPTPENTLAGIPMPEETGAHSPRSIKLEYVDKHTWAVVVNGKMAPGFPKDNPYRPYLPYFRAKSPPTLYPLRYLVPALDALLTMKMNWSYLTAFPPVVLEAIAQVQQMLDGLPTGDTGEPPTNWKFEPGKGFTLPPGYTIRFIEPPSTGKDVDEMIDRLREMIDVAGIPGVFRGIGGSRQPGYAVNQLYAAAQMTYKQLVTNMARQHGKIGDFLTHTVRYTIKQPVYVICAEDDAKKWLGLKPTGEVGKDIAPVDMLGRSIVHFRPALPSDEQAMAMIAVQMLNAPKQPLPHAEILERFFQHPAPQDAIDEIVTDRALDEEPLHSRMIEEAMRMAGLPAAPGPPGMAAGNGRPPGALLNVNDATNSGEPTVPLLTQPLVPARPRTETIGPGQGGRPAGVFPGQPAGQGE